MTIRNLEHAVCLESLAEFSASSRRGSMGHIVLKNILDNGFGSDVMLINPKFDGIPYRPCCHNEREPLGARDLAVIATPSHTVSGTVTYLGACQTCGVQ